MLLGAMALAAIGVVAQIASNGAQGSGAGPLSDPETQKSIAASASSAYLFSIVVGIILMTTEFRHFTSRPTFLIEPRRGRVIVAKMLVAALVGVIYGIVCVALTAAIMIPWFSADGINIGWIGNGVLQSLLSALAVIAIFAVVGIGIGVLVRNQIAAVIGALAYLFVLEPLISIIPVIKNAYPYLPGAAAAAISGANRGSNLAHLDPLQGGLVLLGWGLLFALAGSMFTIRRDIP
jgi:ABC-2 type transport system permease protein